MSSVGSSSPYSTAIVDSSNSTSNAALRLALATLKERCQQLQNRLSMLEEENLQLRIERHNIPGGNNTKKDRPDVVPEIAPLLKKVDELTRQKSKLSHHIYTVATENKHLWETLSKLTEERPVDSSSSGSGSSNLLSTTSLLKPKKSLRTILNWPDANQLCLDEIPLKNPDVFLTNNLGQWNASTASIKECEYPIMDVDDDDDENEMDEIVRSEMLEIVQNFEEDKKLLKQQQHDLKSAIETISKLNRGVFVPHPHAFALRDGQDLRNPMHEDYDNLNSVCSDIEETNRSEGEILKISNGVTLRMKESNFEDRICPLCTKFYAKSTPFDEFNDHVLSHFVEDSEQDSHLSFHEIAT